MSLVTETDERYGSMYCRSSSQNRRKLEAQLLSLYQQSSPTSKCCIFPSGMTAITTIMDSIARKHQAYPFSFVLSSELYSDTYRSVKFLRGNYPNLSFETVDLRNQEQLLQIFQTRKSQIKLFFIESCSNPSGQMFDFDFWKVLQRLAPQCILCVDNTWLSATIFNPFNFGADLVIESMTKYISGGQCIGGMVIGRKKIINPIIDWTRVWGQFIGSDHCQIFLDGLATLRDRIHFISQLGIKIAHFLESRREVARVMYPNLLSHPTHHIFQKYVDPQLGPGCVWFAIPTQKSNLNECREIMKQNKILTYETSFGSKNTKIDPWPILGTSQKYDFSRTKTSDQKVIWIRLSIGYESTLDEIITGLEKLIANFHN